MGWRTKARRRADDGLLAGSGDLVRLPGEDDLFRDGRRGDVREFRDSGECVLLPDWPDLRPEAATVWP